MRFDITTFTLIHVLLSLVGIFAGLVVAGGLVAGERLDGWTGVFLVTTVLTNVTGFGFPFVTFLPSHAIGIISLVVLLIVIVALLETPHRSLAASVRRGSGARALPERLCPARAAVPKASRPDRRCADPKGAALSGDPTRRAGAVCLAGTGGAKGVLRAAGRHGWLSRPSCASRPRVAC